MKIVSHLWSRRARQVSVSRKALLEYPTIRIIIIISLMGGLPLFSKEKHRGNITAMCIVGQTLITATQRQELKIEPRSIKNSVNAEIQSRNPNMTLFSKCTDYGYGNVGEIIATALPNPPDGWTGGDGVGDGSDYLGDSFDAAYAKFLMGDACRRWLNWKLGQAYRTWQEARLATLEAKMRRVKLSLTPAS